jgi:UPF0755 protein
MRSRVKFAAVSFVAMAIMYCFAQFMVPLAPIDEMFEVKIEKGSSFASAVRQLGEEGLVRDRYLFTALGGMTGLDKKLAHGYYQFSGRLRPWDVYRMLGKGDVVQWKVTVVEGNTLMDIKEALVSEGIMNGVEFDSFSTEPEFLESLGINAPSLEGYLFPDTYAVSKDSTPKDVFMMMFRRLEEVYNDEMIRRAEYIGLTRREVLTLASIVEKEAILDSERPIISGVYHNRLNIGMPLQADPTAIYGIKPQSAGITRKDILKKTEYNTYHIKGLPPGPIASPGRKSIEAALNPTHVPYLYFVANFQGGHTFSITMDEHLSAISEYRSRKYAARMAAKAAEEQQAETR